MIIKANKLAYAIQISKSVLSLKNKELGVKFITFAQHLHSKLCFKTYVSVTPNRC